MLSLVFSSFWVVGTVIFPVFFIARCVKLTPKKKFHNPGFFLVSSSFQRDFIWELFILFFPFFMCGGNLGLLFCCLLFKGGLSSFYIFVTIFAIFLYIFSTFFYFKISLNKKCKIQAQRILKGKLGYFASFRFFSFQFLSHFPSRASSPISQKREEIHKKDSFSTIICHL